MTTIGEQVVHVGTGTIKRRFFRYVDADGNTHAFDVACVCEYMKNGHCITVDVAGKKYFLEYGDAVRFRNLIEADVEYL